MNIDGYRNAQQSISKPNPTKHKKDDNTTTKWDSAQVHEDGSAYTNQCDTPHEQKKRQKPHDHLNRCRKSI